MKEDLSPRLNALASVRMRVELLGLIQVDAVHHAKNLVPRRTGNLDFSIRRGALDDKHALVLAGGVRAIGYAACVEFGTGPHTIVPRKAKVLAWGGNRRLSGTLRKGAKAEFFAMKVNHPGTRAKPYLVPGLKAAIEEHGLKNGIVKAWNDAA